MKTGSLPLFLLAVGVFISAIVVIQIKHRNRTLTAQLDQIRIEHQKIDVEWAQLQLEQAALSQHARVEQLARRQFHMTEPPQSQPAEVAR